LVAGSADGSRIASGSYEGTVRLRDVKRKMAWRRVRNYKVTRAE
jgi:hypothetical protein